jgi:hypothetical protein
MKSLALAMLRVYKAIISPYMPGSCRFSPTCSEYAAEAITEYGVIKGAAKTVSRLARCRPGAEGGYDPAAPYSPEEVSAVQARVH